MQQILIDTYLAALLATHPAKLLEPHLPKHAPDFILLIGKAALSMLEATRKAYPQTPFLAVPPNGTDYTLEYGEVIFGTHPIPSLNSVRAAERALAVLQTLETHQHLLILVSGGASAVFCAPKGVTLEQKQLLTAQLLKSGASIFEVNSVRKKLSRVKGGRLVAATKAKVTALILSDVVGDDLSVIASGLTVADTSTFADARFILEQYKIDAPKAMQYLQTQKPVIQETRVTNTIIGSNYLLLEAAKIHLEQLGLKAVILSDAFTGETRDLAGFHAAMIQSIRLYQTPFSTPVVLLSGGESTVTMRGTGQGGRNQEFMLWLLQNLSKDGVYGLSAGSDGIDGNTQAAGAILTPDSWQRAKQAHLESQESLSNNDSGTFFSSLGDQLVTGATGHNLNDIRMIYVE